MLNLSVNQEVVDLAFNVNEVNDRNTNFKIVKGDTFVQKVKIYTDDLLLYVPSEDDIILLQIFNRYTDPEPIFEREIPHDMYFVMNAEETAQMKIGHYVYTIKLIFENGVVDTFMNGNFDIVTAEGVI